MHFGEISQRQTRSSSSSRGGLDQPSQEEKLLRFLQ